MVRDKPVSFKYKVDEVKHRGSTSYFMSVSELVMMSSFASFASIEILFMIQFKE